MSEDRLFCTFRLDSHLFGIEIAEMQEVLRAQEITRVPLARVSCALVDVTAHEARASSTLAPATHRSPFWDLPMTTRTVLIPVALSTPRWRSSA